MRVRKQKSRRQGEGREGGRGKEREREKRRANKCVGREHSPINLVSRQKLS